MKAITLPLLFVALVGAAHAEVTQPAEIYDTVFQAAEEFANKVVDKAKEIPRQENKDEPAPYPSGRIMNKINWKENFIEHHNEWWRKNKIKSPNSFFNISKLDKSHQEDLTPYRDGCLAGVTDIDSALKLAKTHNKKVIFIAGYDECNLTYSHTLHLTGRFGKVNNPHGPYQQVVKQEYYIICYIDVKKNQKQFELFKQMWGNVPLDPSASDPGRYPLILIVDQFGHPMDYALDSNPTNSIASVLHQWVKMVERNESPNSPIIQTTDWGLTISGHRHVGLEANEYRRLK